MPAWPVSIGHLAGGVARDLSRKSHNQCCKGWKGEGTRGGRKEQERGRDRLANSKHNVECASMR
eukprot:7182226-Alexandrium_andersonii.AAC.1